MTNYLETGVIIPKDNGEEDVYQIPYNLNNKFITENQIISILQKFNVNVDKINNIELFYQALTHKSYVKKEVFTDDILKYSRIEMGNPKNLMELRQKSYERLEFFGDTVVKSSAALYLFERYPNEDEGFMTRLKTKLEDKKCLAMFSKKMGLGEFFIISKQIESLNGRNMDKIHEDVFEAFMGALYKSNGPTYAMLLFINLLETEIDYSDKLYKDNNYKDALMRYCHKMKFKLPDYVKLHDYGPSHRKTFIMGIVDPHLDDNTVKKYKQQKKFKQLCSSFGMGGTKKEGEQRAAKMALIIHGELKDDQYTLDDVYYPDWNGFHNNDLSSESESDYGDD